MEEENSNMKQFQRGYEQMKNRHVTQRTGEMKSTRSSFVRDALFL